MTDRETKRKILTTARTIAVVGLSADPARESHKVSAYLQRQGYRIIPVNPTIAEALGEPSHPDLLAVPEPIDVVLVFRRSEDVPPVVEQAIQVGARAVWLQLGIEHGAAGRRAREAGLSVVMDACMRTEHAALIGGAPRS